MKKPKTKPATVGELTPGQKIALDFCKFPDGRIVYGPVWYSELAQRIDRDRNAAIRRERMKERARCVWLARDVEHGLRSIREAIDLIVSGKEPG